MAAGYVAPGAAFADALHSALLEQEELKQREFLNTIRSRQMSNQEAQQRTVEQYRTDALKDLAHSREAGQAKVSFEETPRGMELPTETQELYKRHNLPFMQEPGTLPSRQMAGAAPEPGAPGAAVPPQAEPAPEAPAAPPPELGSMETTESPSTPGKATALGSPREREIARQQEQVVGLSRDLEGVKDRGEAARLLLGRGVPPAAVDDVINAVMGKQADLVPVERIGRSGKMEPVIDSATGQAAMRPRGTHYATEPAPASPQISIIAGTDPNTGQPGFFRVPRRGGEATPVPVQGAGGGQGGQLGQPPTADMRNRAVAYERAAPVLNAIDQLSQKVNTQEGLLAKMSGGAERVAAKLNYDNDVAEYMAVMDSFAPLVARAMGHVGVLTQIDIDSAKTIFPKPGDSKSLRDRKMARMIGLFTEIGEAGPGGGGGGGKGSTRYDMNGNPIPAK